MKKCAYCTKEISYHEMYCSDECQIGANVFYDKREKYQKLFSLVNGIFVIGIGIFIFLYSFMPKAGAFGAAACLLILGVTDFFLPFPADLMIEKLRLKKAIFITRVIAAALFVIGVAVVVLGIIFL